MSELTDDLWSYTLHLYGKPGVPSACLALQDVHGIDVPLLIFATWLARRGAAAGFVAIVGGHAGEGVG